MKFGKLESLPDAIPFAKLSASANDFIVLDNREDSFSNVASLIAQRVCARRYSVGADGLILVENSNRATARIRYINPDGEEFNTCGNGGRCAARYTHLFVKPDQHITMETNTGVVKAEIVNRSVKLQLVNPTEVKLNLELLLDGEVFRGHYVQVGDPHFVVPFKNIRNIDFVTLARKLRHHQGLGPAGANVHFIEPVERNRIKIRSFERGVENETLACGSGCVSSAVSTFRDGKTDPPVTFEPHSGIPVSVHFQASEELGEIYLEGDARLVYRGEFTREALFGFPENLA
ncbi:diaminopimelate epimerase [bacterium]|nr:diaminopimelate epimerase [bacterium]MCI0601467.1 diaminopimelate epimerase [bacterium]